jgi:GntR family transcriptional regulator, rspAB operon transcriptional repressor
MFDIAVKKRDFFGSMTSRTDTAPTELGSLVRREQERRSSLNLAQRTYEDIRAGILRGRFPAGSVLAEGALAEELGVSKTPVRHALNLLKEEGFLTAGPRRQRIVSAISPERREEILEVREALERIAVRKACEMRSLEDIDYLRLLLIRQRRAADVLDEDGFIDLDESFHLGIAAAAHLPIVERMLGNLRGFVRVMRLGTTRNRNHLEQVLAEHEAIVDPIERRDARAALAALAAHFERFNYPA